MGKEERFTQMECSEEHIWGGEKLDGVVRGRIYMEWCEGEYRLIGLCWKIWN